MRLIDADAFIEKLAHVPLVQEAIKKAMDTMPTVDAVPVVRYRECIHRPTINGEWENGFDVEFPDGRCPCQCDDGWYNWMPRDDWFCGNGERK